MENNVKMVRKSPSLKHGAEALVERSIAMYQLITGTKELVSMERAGRKANAAVLKEFSGV